MFICWMLLHWLTFHKERSFRNWMFWVLRQKCQRHVKITSSCFPFEKCFVQEGNYMLYFLYCSLSRKSIEFSKENAFINPKNSFVFVSILVLLRFSDPIKAERLKFCLCSFKFISCTTTVTMQDIMLLFGSHWPGGMWSIFCVLPFPSWILLVFLS